MSRPKPKAQPHTAGIMAALTSVAGLLISPAVLGLAPPKVAVAMTAAGIVLQAFTKPAHAGGTDLVPKP